MRCYHCKEPTTRKDAKGRACHRECEPANRDKARECYDCGHPWGAGHGLKRLGDGTYQCRECRRQGAAFILAHNHPSGDPTPSAEDREATERLKKGAEAIAMPFLDHVVVAQAHDGAVLTQSLKALGWM